MFNDVEEDKAASNRKSDHIDLAFKSAVEKVSNDGRFYYEPMLSSHPKTEDQLPFKFLGFDMNFPLWVSSMTGGTEKAKTINENLARVCGEFGFGMGLGSCRQLLYEDLRIAEFDVKYLMPKQPLFINLGIAQIETLISEKALNRIVDLIEKLNSDGLIIHINPLQEWLQPEGDRFGAKPLDSVKSVLDKIDAPIIIKEVGQGFGPESIKALLKLPIAALDLAGFGGTNFSKLELMRSDEDKWLSYENVFNLGHTCPQMVSWINQFVESNEFDIQCQNVIISGGIKNYLDGYYNIKKCKLPAIYAQASAFLRHAMDMDSLRQFVRYQTEGLKMANAFLKVKE